MSRTPAPSSRPSPAVQPGAVWDGTGVTFALASEHATRVELALFDTLKATEEARRIPLERRSDGIWWSRVEGLGPGTAYGFRVHGPWAPAEGHRFNPAKLLLDPYARAIAGAVDWNGPVFGGGASNDEGPDPDDSAPFVPRSLVIDPSFSWAGDRPPRRGWEDTLIYECHVKGLTRMCPGVPEALRGTYAGLAHETVIVHLQRLGVTAVELLPIHAAVSEVALVRRGLTNYWGYNTLGFFAPDARFAGGDDGRQVTEFKAMVQALHAEGIEVILDVVYNHTPESGADGPTLCLRGVDNAAYYALEAADRSTYVNVTGTGNTIGMHHPLGKRLLLDSLRYWVEEMHVDGFRFDLAPALARTAPEGFREFFSSIRSDPALQEVKLIAEPWDAGVDGYHVGDFPKGWSEWNGKFRDVVRRFWLGDGGLRSELASRLAGSSDLYRRRRGPLAGINFVTCHDGFTLHDLVSYGEKHNEANGEDNRDGSPVNWSHHWGVEGPTDDPGILRLRERMKRNLLATLLLSQGVPMLSHGDEMGRTQGGNNNAYCQDNETAWLDWTLSEAASSLRDFTAALSAIRRANPLFRRTAFLTGKPVGGGGPDVEWIGPNGRPLADLDWGDPSSAFLGMLLRGDQPVFLGMNAGAAPCTVPLPVLGAGHWMGRIDTTLAGTVDTRVEAAEVAGRSLVLCEWHASVE